MKKETKKRNRSDEPTILVAELTEPMVVLKPQLSSTIDAHGISNPFLLINMMVPMSNLLRSESQQRKSLLQLDNSNTL